MICASEIPIYLKTNLIPKKYLYSFFRVWKYSENKLLIYLFNMNIVNIIFNYISILIHINFLITVWNFLTFFLDTCPRFLINYIIFINIDKGLKYLVKSVFYKI